MKIVVDSCNVVKVVKCSGKTAGSRCTFIKITVFYVKSEDFVNFVFIFDAWLLCGFCVVVIGFHLSVDSLVICFTQK